MRFFVFLSLLLPSLAHSEQDNRYYYDVYADQHRYRYYQANEGRYYEWSKPGLSEVSVCVELDKETKGEQYRMQVDDAYCPQFKKSYTWSAPSYGRDSHCLEVDSETEGLRFKRITEENNCAKIKPQTVYAWVKTENSLKENCYSVDSESRGEKYRRPAKATSCPMVYDVYAAFSKKRPAVVPPSATRDPSLSNGGRMPASLSHPVLDDQEEEDALWDEGIRKYWEDPEDMIRHVPDSSRKGY